jgi:UDP-3-O-[3-hydroxymyristoyl] N-acetylglucosamine deacetylase
MKLQQTLASGLEITGQALHSGVWVTIRILPQPVNTGIYFGRSDLPGVPQVKAGVNAVVDTKKSVAVGKDGWRIATIEHLMAVFHGLGIDNALVLVDGEEIPLGDGSGLYFVERILAAGIITQDQPRRYLSIQEPVWVEGTVNKQDEPVKAWLIGLPGDEEQFQVCFTFTSDHPTTGTQYFQYTLTRESFIKEIAPARTVAFMKEIEYLRSQGLALGGDLNSVVVVDDDGYRNKLRFPDEIVRHKILDILGDLYLLGPLAGNLVAVRSGHALDLALAKKIFQGTTLKIQ